MSARKTRILVVDDEVSFTRLLQLNLEQTGDYEVQVENVPTMATTTAERFRPDLILLDVMMPGMDGGELAAEFQRRSKLRKVPVVFLTAAVKREEVNAHGGLIGGMPFIAKPVDMQELTGCIQKYLGQ